MTKAEIQQQALELSPAERQELAFALWESLEEEPAPLPEWELRLLDERLAHLQRHTEEGELWEEVEKRIWPDAG